MWKTVSKGRAGKQADSDSYIGRIVRTEIKDNAFPKIFSV